ncbi:MAG: VOC family protein [Bacteroidota bacterium]
MKTTIMPRLFALAFLASIVLACQNTAEKVEEAATEAADTAVELIDENDTDFASRSIAIGLMVADLDASINFYHNILGLPEAGGFDLEGGFGIQSGLTDNQPLSIKQYSFGKGDAATILKLVTTDPPVKAHDNSAFIHDDNSVQYLTVYVKDIDPFVERLRAANIEFKGNTPINIGSEEEPQAFVLVQDPDGTFVELIEEK